MGERVTLTERISILLVVGVIFVDVPVPILGSVARFAVLPVAMLVMLGGQKVRVRRLAVLAVLLVAYCVFPWAFHSRDEIVQVMYELVAQLTFVGVAVLAARHVSVARTRNGLADAFVLFAVVSALVAFGQRTGLVVPLGRNLWGRAETAAGELRGAGFLADPNFLAVLLAASVPVILHWRQGWMRVSALVAVALGLYATDSRTGILLAVGGVLAVLLAKTEGEEVAKSRRTKRVMIATSVVVAVLFASNAGGQRDRVVEGLQVAIGGETSLTATSDFAAAASASDRREYAEAWFRMGVDNLPFGGGVGAEDLIVTRSGERNAAHNNFVQMLGQGGIAGVLAGLLTLATGTALYRRRGEPFAAAGLVVIAGGLFLSYPGTALIALPLGIADGLSSNVRRRATVDVRARQSASQGVTRARHDPGSADGQSLPNRSRV